MALQHTNGKNTQVGIAAPNPSYPQPIQIVTGEQEVVVRGKNYFDNSITPSIQNGPDVPIATGKRVSYTGTNGGTRFNAYAIMDLTNFIGSTIRFKSKFIPSNENLGNYYIGLCDSEGNNRTTLSNAGGVNEKEVSFIVPQLEGTKKYLCLALYMNSGGTLAQNDYVDYTNMILTIDEEDMTYEPYTEPITKQLSLGNKELFEDSFISWENGDYYFNDVYKRYIGTLTYNSYNADYKRALARMPISGIEEVCISGNAKIDYCTIAKNVTGTVNTTNPNASFTVRVKDTHNNNVNFWFDDFTTSEIAEAFFNNREFNIVYKLETPIKTPITDTTLINQLEDIYNMPSVNGTTIVEINGNLPMIIKCRALSK